MSELMAGVKAKNPGELEFHQAVQEVAESLTLVLDREPRYRKAKILERIIEPERVIMFRVAWQDDKGELHVQRGFRIQMNSAIGPYKGGLRFHPTREFGNPQISRFRTSFQKRADHAADGRRQRRLRFRSARQERFRSDAVLSGVHVRAVAAHRAGHGRAGGRHRRRRARDRVLVRHVQETEKRVHRSNDRQRSHLGRLGHSAGSDRLRRGLFRGRNAQDAKGRFERQDRAGLRQRQRCSIHDREVDYARREAGHAVGFVAVTFTTRPESIGRSSRL